MTDDGVYVEVVRGSIASLECVDVARKLLRRKHDQEVAALAAQIADAAMGVHAAFDVRQEGREGGDE